MPLCQRRERLPRYELIPVGSPCVFPDASRFSGVLETFFSILQFNKLMVLALRRRSADNQSSRKAGAACLPS